jgi:copper chaperone
MSQQLHEIQVQGMSCQHCVKGVTQAIQEQDSQAEVLVDLAKGRVQARTFLSLDEVSRAIDAEGYKVER